MDEQRLQLDLFWGYAFPLVEAVLSVDVGVDANLSASDRVAQIKQLWQRCKEYLHLHLPTIADDLAYAAAAWVDEMLLANPSSILQLWQAAPLQLFYRNDLNAGARFFDLYDCGLHGRLGRIKAWWFGLWLDLGFHGARHTSDATLSVRNTPIAIDNNLVAHLQDSNRLYSFFNNYKLPILLCVGFYIFMHFVIGYLFV